MSDTVYLTAEQAAHKLGKSSAWVRHLCANGRVQGATKHGNSWMIPDPPVLLGRVRQGNLTATEAANLMGLSRQRVIELCKIGGIEGAAMQNGIWSIPYPIKRIERKNGRPKQEVVAA